MEKIKQNDTLTCVNENPLEGNSIAPPVKEGNDYPLLNIHTCSCNKEHYDIGLPLEYNWVSCYDCKEQLPPSTHWAHPSRFIKKEA